MTEPLAPFGSAPDPGAESSAAESGTAASSTVEPRAVPEVEPEPEPAVSFADHLEAVEASADGGEDVDLPKVLIDEVEEVAEVEDEAREGKDLAHAEAAENAEDGEDTDGEVIGVDRGVGRGGSDELGDADEEGEAGGPGAGESAAAVEAVADRLEELARMLREKGPAGLLLNRGQRPLDLLIAGYALGYSAGFSEPESVEGNS